MNKIAFIDVYCSEFPNDDKPYGFFKRDVLSIWGRKVNFIDCLAAPLVVIGDCIICVAMAVSAVVMSVVCVIGMIFLGR